MDALSCQADAWSIRADPHSQFRQPGTVAGLLYCSLYASSSVKATRTPPTRPRLPVLDGSAMRIQRLSLPRSLGWFVHLFYALHPSVLPNPLHRIALHPVNPSCQPILSSHLCNRLYHPILLVRQVRQPRACGVTTTRLFLVAYTRRRMLTAQPSR